MDSAAKPLRPRRLGQLPTAWGAFCAGFAREKASSRSGEVTSEAKSEGLLAPRARRPLTSHRPQHQLQPVFSPAEIGGGVAALQHAGQGGVSQGAAAQRVAPFGQPAR